MGAIWFSRASFQGTVGELIGYKAGLALDASQMADLSPEEYKDHFIGDLDAALRVRSEVFEEIVAGILYRVGNISSPEIARVGIKLFHHLKGRSDELRTYMRLLDAMYARLANLISGEHEAGQTDAEDGESTLAAVVGQLTSLNATMANGRILKFDRREFAEFAYANFGEQGLALAHRMIADFNAEIHRSPWLGFRQTDFKDIVALEELFRSESLHTSRGTFLDQRFIDFLSANEADVGKMNWRKFEGLVGEYFTREGYVVSLGPGRGDDGIDARVWTEKPGPGDPATIIVQCKRQKEEVAKVIVKSLWADVIAEGAKSGLIVTTSRLSPGSAKTISARQYPIEVADGATVVKWLRAMRSPIAGPFLAE